ncbi:MAG: toll/interleukin-1 receptor domain-containing protein [Promethearchaeota archaeon]
MSDKTTQHKKEEKSLIMSFPEKNNKKKGILVFVSYATKDSEIFKIREISEKLTKYDNIDDVLYWEEDMHDNIYKYMNDNLGRCNVMLLFCSFNALNSVPVEKEWTAIDAMGKPIIPIFLKKEYIPPLLQSRLGIKFNPLDLQYNVNSIHNLILKKTGFKKTIK